MASESPSSKKEPPWPSTLAPMPRISVSAAAPARLSHRRPILLAPRPVPVPAPAGAPGAGAGAIQSPPSPLPSPKSTWKPSESPMLDTLPASAPTISSSRSPARTAAAGAGPGPACSSATGLHSGDGAGRSLDAARRPGNVWSLSTVDSSGNLSAVCTASELANPSNPDEAESPGSFPIVRFHSPFPLGGDPGIHWNCVGFGTDSVDGLNKATDGDIRGLSRDKCTSSDMKIAVAETALSVGCRGALEEVNEYEGAGIRLDSLDGCREAEASDLIRTEELGQDEGELWEGQQLGGGGREAEDRDVDRPKKGCSTSSDMEITSAESRSSPSCHNGLEGVDGCKGVFAQVNYENCAHVGREAEISDLDNKGDLVLNEAELEDGQLPGEWSGGEESYEEQSREDSEPAQMLVDTAVCPVVIRNESNPIYYPFQVEGTQCDPRSRGNSKAKGKKKKKHKKGEGSIKRYREKSKEKHNEVLKKRMAERKGLDGGANTVGLRNSNGSSGRGDRTGNKNGTVELNEAPGNLSQTLPKKLNVDEGPEDGEILLESTKTNDGILSSLVEAEVGLWTTDDVDDQFVAEMEQDGALKRKRGPETAERKLKRKIAKRKKRAQKERELGIRRPPRMAQSKPVKVLCTHYMKGRCSKGDQCTFSHDAIPLTKQEPCKFLMSHSCLKGDDCPYSHDLRAFPCKFFHTRGLCYDGKNCQFSHKTISEEALAKLKERVEKEKKERMSSTSALDIPTPFSTALPPELDPDPLGWGTPILEQMQYTKPTILDQSSCLSSDINLESHGRAPPQKDMMPCQSIGFSTSTDRKDAESSAASPQPSGERAGEYNYVQFSNSNALQSEKATDVRRFKSEGESSVLRGLALTEVPHHPTTSKFLKAPVFPYSESSNAKGILEIPQMEEKMDPAQSLRGELVTSSNESGPKDVVSGPPSLLSPLLTRTVMPLLRGRQLGSIVLEHEKAVEGPVRTEPKRRQHTVDSLLHEALRQ